MINFILGVIVTLVCVYGGSKIYKKIMKSKNDDDSFSDKYRNPPKSGPRIRTLGRS